ncbi:MAG: hypothetical protein SFZ03_03100 [Candidatus Melainabacteria bacterium]|nr:hypothetical protein [Candidatus Melainabacteria bacterium]
MDSLTHPSSTENASAESHLSQLMEADRLRVLKFKEHLELARQMVTDARLQVVFDHMMEEESEHLEKLDALRQSVSPQSVVPQSVAMSATAAVSPAVAHSHPSAPVTAPVSVPASVQPDGHFQRRDQNILTVGSLYGHQQV